VNGCVLSVDGARLFCATWQLHSVVSVFDAQTLETLTSIPATLPTSVAISSQGDRLYIAHQDNRVTVHDSTTYALLATVMLPTTPLALAVTPDGAHLYAALNDRSIADIDTTSNTVAGVIPDVTLGGNLPLHVTSAKGKYGWCSAPRSELLLSADSGRFAGVPGANNASRVTRLRRPDRHSRKA
jgi:DNA-binding beta-propeller fold protein YncE